MRSFLNGLQPLHISEDICGNKCMDGHRICTCGNTNYSIHEMRTQRLYCCNKSPCETIDKYIVCKTGVVKNVDEKCENECPLSEGESFIFKFS